jgi:hypothetical protein
MPKHLFQELPAVITPPSGWAVRMAASTDIRCQRFVLVPARQ